MIKQLKFRKEVAEAIISGSKDSTWRLFDELDLRQDEIVELIVRKTHDRFAKARITKVVEKKFSELTDTDWEGRKRFDSDEEMFKTFSNFYNKPVDENTVIKIVHFHVLMH